jgi:hypothetical protein
VHDLVLAQQKDDERMAAGQASEIDDAGKELFPTHPARPRLETSHDVAVTLGRLAPSPTTCRHRGWQPLLAGRAGRHRARSASYRPAAQSAPGVARSVGRPATPRAWGWVIAGYLRMLRQLLPRASQATANTTTRGEWWKPKGSSVEPLPGRAGPDLPPAGSTSGYDQKGSPGLDRRGPLGPGAYETTCGSLSITASDPAAAIGAPSPLCPCTSCGELTLPRSRVRDG